jgi:DNA helicase-2/ATP-dependent DNA helicase PcrA
VGKLIVLFSNGFIGIMNIMLNEDFEKSLNLLNEKQREAVDSIEGPVVVVAGPGTGKTKILTTRIANILKETDTNPENILALTYTTAGVVSMRQKLLEVIGDRAYRVNIFTFHAFCEYIIKEFNFYFEKLESFRVIEDLERVKLVEEIIGENKFKHLVSFQDEFYFLNKIISAILAIKKEGLSPKAFNNLLPEWKRDLLADEDIYYKKDYGEYKKGDLKPQEEIKIEKKIGIAEELARVFESYQEKIESCGWYDFSDMILNVLEELKKNKNLRDEVQEKYQYILVDEHQDTNEGQNSILELLTNAPHLEGRPNLFTVGDPKQSIYRFQGASEKTFARFEELYKDIKKITLTENYRSIQNILDGAHRLIIKSEGLEEVAVLHSNNNSENQKIKVRQFSNYKFELLYLADEIKTKIDSGISPKEIAVLYRKNKDVSDIKTLFDYYQIPYTIFSKDKILDDPNISNLINILKVVFNPNDNHYLAKILFVNFFGLDSYDVVKILDHHKGSRGKEGKHLFSILEKEETLKEIGVNNPNSFLDLVNTIKELKTESLNRDFPDFFKLFLNKIGYIKHMLDSADSRTQLVKLDKFFDEIKRQSQNKKQYGLDDFIYFVDSFEKYHLDIESSDPEIINGVSLMTAHGSKGREFEFVYILDATRKSWELKRGGQSLSLPVYQYDGDKEDERRLFYVAMTRAKKELSISYSKTDNLGKEQEASEFVVEIDDNVKEEEKMDSYEEKNIDKLYSFISFQEKGKSLFDRDYLKQLFLERGLNVSALNNYLECPKKYLYKNLIRIPDVYSMTLFFGSAIHNTLEAFFIDSKNSGKILGKEILLEKFNNILNKANLSQKEEGKIRERGQALLSDYYDEYSRNWNHRVKVEFSSERTFELNNKEIINLNGKVDKIEYLNEDYEGEVNLIDYKTGHPYSEKSKEDKACYERQIVFYHLLLEGDGKENIQIGKSVLDFLEKNKKGKYEQYSFPVTKEHIDKLKAEINEMAEGVLSMDFLKKGCGKPDCPWCNM